MNSTVLIVICAVLLLATCQFEAEAQRRGLLPAKIKKPGITAPRVILVPHRGAIPRAKRITTL